MTAPKGYALEGWRLSVFWPRVREFYEGTVTRYDPELNEHTISYNDGDISLSHAFPSFTWFCTHRVWANAGILLPVQAFSYFDQTFQPG